MSKSKIVDPKHQAALAARRVRDKNARDCFEDSYIKKLIRKEHPGFDSHFPELVPELVAAKKISLAGRRLLAGKFTPEMDAAYQAFAETLIREIDLKEKRKV